MGDAAAAPGSVVLTSNVAAALEADCAADPDRERCGLVGGRSGVGVTLYPVANAAGDPVQSFLLDARGQIEAFRRMRERGEALYAIYHYHPTTAAEPSPRDVSEAAYPEAAFLIVSLATDGPELRAYRWYDRGFEAAPLVVTPAG